MWNTLSPTNDTGDRIAAQFTAHDIEIFQEKHAVPSFDPNDAPVHLLLVPRSLSANLFAAIATSSRDDDILGLNIPCDGPEPTEHAIEKLGKLWVDLAALQSDSEF